LSAGSEKIANSSRGHVMCLLVVVPVPDHDPSIVGQLLRELQHAVVQVLLGVGRARRNGPAGLGR
jgi:hypothetical protein